MTISSDIRLIYGHDTLCGWCYGLIPALRRFASKYPQIPIEVVSGGLFSGDRVRPYKAMFSYIEEAFTRVRAKTGCHGSDQFFTMINAPETGLITSAVPTYALMQLQILAPDRVIEFAHALQEVHFEQGRSLNDRDVYDWVLKSLDLPSLDSQAIVSATDAHSLVRKSYDRSSQLGILSYPTCFVVDGNDRHLGIISGIYQPDRFIATFEQIIHTDKNASITSICA